jgi:hypothetical protein
MHGLGPQHVRDLPGKLHSRKTHRINRVWIFGIAPNARVSGLGHGKKAAICEAPALALRHCEVNLSGAGFERDENKLAPVPNDAYAKSAVPYELHLSGVYHLILSGLE